MRPRNRFIYLLGKSFYGLVSAGTGLKESEKYEAHLVVDHSWDGASFFKTIHRLVSFPRDFLV